MTLLIQAFTIFLLIQLYQQFFSIGRGIIDLTLLGIALSLSLLVSYYVGLVFKKGLKYWPLFAGMTMGVVAVLLFQPLIEWVSGLDLPLWLNIIFVTIGVIFGAYIGVRLAFVILIFI